MFLHLQQADTSTEVTGLWGGFTAVTLVKSGAQCLEQVLRISAINNCLSYNFGFGWFLLLLFSPFALTLGLRKLEAFFGFLITIMALTFGYEVGSQSHNRALHHSHPILPHAEPNRTGERTLAMPYPRPTSPPIPAPPTPLVPLPYSSLRKWTGG